MYYLKEFLSYKYKVKEKNQHFHEKKYVTMRKSLSRLQYLVLDAGLYIC